MLLVQLHEIIPDRVKRDHVRVVLELLREGVCQPREPAHLHPQREVLALGVGR